MKCSRAFSGTALSSDPRAFIRLRESATENLYSHGFPFSQKLVAHESFVNALTFSHGPGRWLASGGDDRRVFIWDFHQDDVGGAGPTGCLLGAQGNVYAIAFSASDNIIYSGGTNDVILKHDLSRMLDPGAQFSRGQSSAVAEYRQHTGSIRGLSAHPTRDDIFMSGSEDGKVLLHDDRERRQSMAQGILQLTAVITDVQFHPTMEHLFVTSDGLGDVALRDTRMVFGPIQQRSRGGLIHAYNTKITSKAAKQLCRPEASSVCFDREGTKLAVTMLHHTPTIYATFDSQPIAMCNGRRLPDGVLSATTGERTYSNSCTVKHGSFGGAGSEDDSYYAAGSDDFRGYVWKVPSVSTLTERRTELSADQWENGAWPNTIAYADELSAPHFIPEELSTPFFRLNGHKSVVHAALFHPHLPFILTSGVERHLLLHSPAQMRGLAPTAVGVRALPPASPDETRRLMHAVIMIREGAAPGSGLAELETGDEDASTIALFDEILRQEGEADVFALRQSDERSDDRDEE